MVNGFVPFEVTSQTKMEDLTPDGRFEQVWEVRFKTPSGTHGFVRVPADMYHPEVVERMVEDEVQRIEAVRNLGGSPINGDEGSGF